MIFRNAEGRRGTVPQHTGKVLHPKLLKSILADAELSVEQLRELARIIHDATRFPARCHSERSEESAFLSEILRCAQNDMNNAG
jgi:hypothetical protein